jgi:DNA-directed RNA polymerase II subunit RPB1
MDEIARELQSSDNLKEIKEIQFSILGNDELDRGAVVEILTSDTYDGLLPKTNGLFDTRMGPIDKYIKCPIDEQVQELCPGYFGKIKLAKPVFNFIYINYIEKILKCFCFRCSNILLDKSNPAIMKDLMSKTGEKRFKAVIAYCKNINKCSHNNGCFVLQPKKYTRLTLDKMLEKVWIVKIKAEFDQPAFKDSKIAREYIFGPEKCYRIFSRISDEDVDLIGLSSKYSRPERMIIKILAVPPPVVRPSIRQDNNQRSEDDLTYTLSQIIKQNRDLRKRVETDSKKDISTYHGVLQYYIASYMNNDIPGVPNISQKTSMRPLKSFEQRLKGKEGRIRCNIQGKRVDFSARTVISCDPCLGINEFGVPIKIAKNLTYPEIVNKYNISRMYKLIKNGPNRYPGAKSYKEMRYDALGNADPVEYSLRKIDINSIELKYGDIVNRHLQTGDICLFNRQPTLHRMSMMAHHIRVVPGKTFRLNVLVCNPYNADFDKLFRKKFPKIPEQGNAQQGNAEQGNAQQGNAQQGNAQQGNALTEFGINFLCRKQEA